MVRWGEWDPKATSRQSYLVCWGPGAPPGWEHPSPGPADPGVLSSAFPEELPADRKHRKLGEQGWCARGGEEGGLGLQGRKARAPQVHIETGI